MRCLACNSILTNYDSCVIDLITGEYFDFCKVCREATKELYHTFNRQDPLLEEEIAEEWQEKNGN